VREQQLAVLRRQILVALAGCPQETASPGGGFKAALLTAGSA
jgi:hypothetical protein